ncbi:TraR/DksA C4-type zinc finger protein [Marinobacter sp. NFXS9]|uniref:TraR/DksA C4-type zinc finger protein n=1 Tax=Marinobacter sp. NFXS9 TaxID=2818433 RepID=UPI0032DF8AAF
MADKADIAGEYIEQELERALENRRTQPQPANDDPYCEECGFEIPAKRREALPGCATCVDCQQTIELKKRTTGQ